MKAQMNTEETVNLIRTQARAASLMPEIIKIASGAGFLSFTPTNPADQSKAELITAIHSYVRTNCKHFNSKAGIEEFRTPARTWHDQGGTLISLVGLASALLHCAQLPHYYCLARCDGRDYYQHIYIIIPEHEHTLSLGFYSVDLLHEKPFWESEHVTYRKYIKA